MKNILYNGYIWKDLTTILFKTDIEFFIYNCWQSVYVIIHITISNFLSITRLALLKNSIFNDENN